MTMASTSDGAVLVQAPVNTRTPWWRGSRFVVEVFDGADEALAALETVQGGLVSTGFQTLNWLTFLYEELAPSQRAQPRLVVVTERNSGDIAMILPLVIRKKRTLRVARFADLGVSHCGAPILGPAVLKKPRSMRRIWRACRHALRDVDLIRLERMPAEIGGRQNPLVLARGVAPSRRGRNVVAISGSIDDYLDGLGDVASRDIERCRALWQREDGPQFVRAVTADAVARAYGVLEEQELGPPVQTVARKFAGEPAYRQFFERLVMDGTEVELGYMFTLEAADETIATLFGIEHEGTFSILRLSGAAAEWKALEPERLICIEAMRFFVARGVRRFDLGAGCKALKSGLGAGEMPLVDLIIARDLAGLPRAAFHRAKGRLRKNARLRGFFHGLGRSRGV